MHSVTYITTCVFREQPLINTDTVDIDYLGNLPEGTFGKAYWHFLDKNVSCSFVRLQSLSVMHAEQQHLWLTTTLLATKPFGWRDSGDWEQLSWWSRHGNCLWKHRFLQQWNWLSGERRKNWPLVPHRVPVKHMECIHMWLSPILVV